MSESKEIYSNQWNSSSNYFYDNGDYSWMCDNIKKYKTILEVGCGTGHSTLELLKSGHKVIAIEKNEFCLEKAKSLLEENNYKTTEKFNLKDYDVMFVPLDLCDKSLIKILEGCKFDAIVCWNVGSYWDKEMIQYYAPKMIEYGLTVEEIKSDLESSYVELIQWQSCKIAKEKGVPVHFIDRGMEELLKGNDPYYIALKNDFKFSKIEYDNKKSKTISNNGRVLSCKGKVITNNEIDIYFNSIIMK